MVWSYGFQGNDENLLNVSGFVLRLRVVPLCSAAMASCTRLLTSSHRCESLSVLKRIYLKDVHSFEPVLTNVFSVDPVGVKSEADDAARQAAFQCETDRSHRKAFPGDFQGCGYIEMTNFSLFMLRVRSGSRLSPPRVFSLS